MLKAISEGNFENFVNSLKSHDATSDETYGLFVENYDGMVTEKFTGKAVHAAAYFGRLDVIQYLNDTYGSACFNDNKSEYFQQVKFEKNPMIVSNCTPMMWACAGGQKDAFNLLKKLGASDNGCDTCQISSVFHQKFTK